MAIQDLVTNIFNDLTQVIESQIGSSVSAITTAIAPVMVAALLVYVVFIAYKIMYTNNEVFMSEVIKNVMTLALVSAFTVSTPYYIEYVVPFVTGAGDQISSAITGSPASATALDAMINNVQTSINKMLDDMHFSIFDMDLAMLFRTGFAIGLTYIGSFVFIFYAAAYLLVAKFMVGLLLSVGTIFICFAFYPTTRGFFTSWCGQCLNYIFLNVMLTLTLGILNAFITSKFDLADMGVQSSFQIIIVFFISVFVVQQIGVLVSSLTGGMGINGLTGATNSLMGKGAGGIQRLAQGAKAKGSSIVSTFLKSGIKGG
ncbi:TPA: type IV secretion system protein [Salmonella enterica subsp. enterica serovar Concord]|nr:type IV secretion system protein [Salmonella enterica subsp. enterica serovar Concord]